MKFWSRRKQAPVRQLRQAAELSNEEWDRLAKKLKRKDEEKKYVVQVIDELTGISEEGKEALKNKAEKIELDSAAIFVDRL